MFYQCPDNCFMTLFSQQKIYMHFIVKSQHRETEGSGQNTFACVCVQEPDKKVQSKRSVLNVLWSTTLKCCKIVFTRCMNKVFRISTFVSAYLYVHIHQWCYHVLSTYLTHFIIYVCVAIYGYILKFCIQFSLQMIMLEVKLAEGYVGVKCGINN